MTNPAVKIFEVPVYDDPEVTAMGAIVAVLSGLDDAAKVRVLKWAARKYAQPTKQE